jgi:FMN phosphatase YigB (HAD superfamily)
MSGNSLLLPDSAAMNLQSYSLISFDLFQTLADLQTQKPKILQKIFCSSYTRATADKFWKDADAYIYAYFHRLSTQNEEFVPVSAIFEQCYTELFPLYHVSRSPADGAHIVTTAHNDAALYEDTLPVITELKKTKHLCIISDTDNSMIQGLKAAIGIEKIYTSENYRAYKFDRRKILFNAALNDFAIPPEHMLHIGDGSNDVLGAAAAGAHTVWINRNNQCWTNSIKPDFEITSLRELLT